MPRGSIIYTQLFEKGAAEVAFPDVDNARQETQSSGRDILLFGARSCRHSDEFLDVRPDAGILPVFPLAHSCHLTRALDLGFFAIQRVPHPSWMNDQTAQMTKKCTTQKLLKSFHNSS
jgi:hypothetical protein